MARRVRGLLALAHGLALGAAWSCSSQDVQPTVLAGRAIGCTLNSDCASPLKCIFQRCHGACVETADCERGERCIRLPEGDICQLASEMECTYTSQCNPPLKCAVDSKCRTACLTQDDCLVSQRCVTGVCADPDQLDVNTGSLPVTNSNGYTGMDAGVTDAGMTDADVPDAAIEAGPPDASTEAGLPDASLGDASAPDASVSDGSLADGAVGDGAAGDGAPGDAGPDAASPCSLDAGVIGNFQPSNLPATFAVPGVKPLVVTSLNCRYDTDTLSATSCGTTFATDSASSAVTLSDGRSAAVLTVAGLTLNASAALTFSGQRPLIIVSTGRVEINGTIQTDASATNGAWGGGAPAPATGDHVGFTPLVGGPGGGGKGNSAITGFGAGGGGFCGPGGHGSAVDDAGAPASGGLSYGTPSLVPLVGGSSGGTALGGYPNVTGHGGGALQIVSGDTIFVGQLGIINMGGGFPSSPGKSIAGGGGGSGGAILLEAPNVTVLGVLAANGGGGGGGYLEHGDAAQPSATPAQGGGLGGDGAAGMSVAGQDAASYTGTQYPGGGGGGAGRIRINVGCGGKLTLDAAAVVSPDPSSSCYSTGTLE